MPQYKDLLQLWREIVLLKTLKVPPRRIAELLSISEDELERIERGIAPEVRLRTD